MDEVSKQLLSEVRAPLPMRSGQAERFDYEYKREGVVNVFLSCEPLKGQSFWGRMTDRRTKVDWAHCIKDIGDVRYPEAKRIILVMDNLNTQTPAALYEVFSPGEAKRLVDNLEIHYTPIRGSWLNVAEVELSVLIRQCLKRRIPDKESLATEAERWQTRCNRASGKVNWRLTTDDARIKLKRLYLSV